MPWPSAWAGPVSAPDMPILSSSARAAPAATRRTPAAMRPRARRECIRMARMVGGTIGGSAGAAGTLEQSDVAGARAGDRLVAAELDVGDGRDARIGAAAGESADLDLQVVEALVDAHEPLRDHVLELQAGQGRLGRADDLGHPGLAGGHRPIGMGLTRGGL